MVNRALERGLSSNKNISFLAVKIGDDCKRVDTREQLETVTSAEYHGRFTEI